MSTMKTRIRARLDPYLLPAVRDQVIADVLEELERPSAYMLERGRIKSREEGASLEDCWVAMIRTAIEGG